MDDEFEFDISRDDAVRENLGDGQDTVRIDARRSVEQVRLTFTSSEVGDDDPRDSETLENQDGGLAVRVQAERGDEDRLVGDVSRFDDEGITFESRGRFTFDVRDLVSGVARGDDFDNVTLGTRRANTIDESAATDSYYINGGLGDDNLLGGIDNDFLVGGADNDRLRGNDGDDSFIGGGGDDRIFGGLGDDTAIVNLATDGADNVQLGRGLDAVSVTAPEGARQIRLTFTSAEVGDGSVLDSGELANQDGGIAVRMQAEDDSGDVVDPIGRYDDEGVSFTTAERRVTFDVRDLVSGTERGDRFDVVTLGTISGDRYNERGERDAYYINAGLGEDRLDGGRDADFLVGGKGRDRINGREDDDSLLGGIGRDVFKFSGAAGNDSIVDFASGADRIDFRSYSIDFDDIETSEDGDNTLIDVNLARREGDDFQITLLDAGAPVESDFLFA